MNKELVKILYVDDEKSNLTNFKFLFQDDYEIYTALTAKEGLEVLKSSEFHIIISDQRMPDMVGIEFLSQVATLYPDSIRILLTAFTEIPDIINAINIGHVYQYITKPYQEKAVKLILEKAAETWYLKKLNQKLLIELKEKNEEYEQLNEELRQSNEELYHAKERAEESDRLKTAFLQNLSHEIRTPMNAIMGFSQLMKDSLEDKPKLMFFTDIISNRCFDLLDIINDLLDISMIESGKMHIKNDECNINELFEELSVFFTEYRKRLKKEHISFNLNIDRNRIIKIKTDKGKLKQVLINLLSNALKFTEVGSITGGCNLDSNNRIHFYVTDTGIGIPLEKQKVVFDRFVKLEDVAKQNVVGTGLGLAIVKGLVNAMGGEIHLDSAPGKGSTFTFSFLQDSIAENKKTLPAQTTRSYLKNSLVGKKALLVEDDIYNIAFIKEILIETGLEIIFAGNGEDAVNIANSQSIDIIFMDIRLPDMNGYEATRQILLKNPDAKIVAQTAYATYEEKQKAILSGCVDYISKPIKADLLYAMIAKVLSIS